MLRPYFVWDYDYTEEELREILRSGSDHQKAWLISRLLGHAQWNDIWKYVTPAQIDELFPKLSFWPKITKETWRHALDRWLRAA